MIVVKYFDGVSYTVLDSVLQGFTIHETIDDTLDEATIVFNSNSEKFLSLWDSIKIEVDTFAKFFLIADIKVKNRHTNNNTYEHTLTLIEPTKYLEKITGLTLAFTNRESYSSLGSQINRALLNAEPLEEGTTPRFTMSLDMSTKMLSYPSEDFFYEKSTLREVLDGLLSAVNCRVEVREITDFNDITLDYYDLNETLNLITFSEYVNKELRENIEYLGTDIEAYGDNSFSGNRDAIYHPSPNGWDSFKTNEATLTTENAVISTRFPIEEIKQFIMPIDYSLTLKDSAGNDTPTEVISTNLDINDNVVDIETYDILSNSQGFNEILTTSFYKENTVFFERQEESVSIEKIEQLIFFTTTSLEKAIRNVLYKNGVLQDYLDSHPELTDTYTLSDISLANFDVLKTLFRIKYVPYIDAHAKIGKVSYDEVKSSIIDNQNDKIIDLSRYGDNLYGNINRLGNPNLILDKKLSNVSDKYNISDFTNNGYVLVTRDLGFYNHFVKAHYEFTQDFTNLSEKIGIDRRKRIYKIPLENMVRDILIKEYVKVDFSGTLESNQLITEYMKTFTSSNRCPITNALTKTYWVIDQETGATAHSNLFELAVVGYSMATSILFHFKFDDNYSAGMSSENQVIGGIKQTPNPYVNENGEYDKIHIRLINGEVTRPTDYNTVKQLPLVQESWYSSAIIPFDKTLQIKKDTYEHHRFTYQLETVSSDKDIIIGYAIAKLNSLLNNVTNNLYLYVSTTEKYSRSQNRQPKGSLATGGNISITLNKLSVSFFDFNVISWGIADENNNLLIGVNKKDNEEIKLEVMFNYSSSR